MKEEGLRQTSYTNRGNHKEEKNFFFLHSTRDKKETIIPKIEKLFFFLSTGTATNG